MFGNNSKPVTAAGTFGAANQNGVPSDTANTWTAPSGSSVQGTYRITCTITDAQSRVFVDSVTVDISTLALQNIFLAPATVAINNVLAATNLGVAAPNADPGQQISAGLTNPAHPRNVVITILDVDNSITSGTVRVTGIDARGLSQSEVISIAASAGGSSTSTGLAPFATVTRIDVFSFVGATLFTDELLIGIGTKFGLTGQLNADSDVLYVNEAGTVITAGYTVDSTAGQQGITFASAPNAARNYVVVFRAR